MKERTWTLNRNSFLLSSPYWALFIPWDIWNSLKHATWWSWQAKIDSWKMRSCVSYFRPLQRSMSWAIEVLLPVKPSLLTHRLWWCTPTNRILSSSETLGSLPPSPPHSGHTRKSFWFWNSAHSSAHSIGKDEWQFYCCSVLLEKALNIPAMMIPK
jgi:hypothetical protein